MYKSFIQIEFNLNRIQFNRIELLNFILIAQLYSYWLHSFLKMQLIFCCFLL